MCEKHPLKNEILSIDASQLSSSLKTSLFDRCFQSLFGCSTGILAVNGSKSYICLP